MSLEPVTHRWDEHRFIKHMASDFGLVVDRDSDYVLYSRCYCGDTPLDALMAARVMVERPDNGQEIEWWAVRDD